MSLVFRADVQMRCAVRNPAQRFAPTPCRSCDWAIIVVLSHFQQAFRAALESCHLANLLSPASAVVPPRRAAEAWNGPLGARERPPERPPTQRRTRYCPVAVADHDTLSPSGQTPRQPTSEASTPQGRARRTCGQLQDLQPPRSTAIRLPGMKTCTRFRRGRVGPPIRLPGMKTRTRLRRRPVVGPARHRRRVGRV